MKKLLLLGSMAFCLAATAQVNKTIKASEYNALKAQGKLETGVQYRFSPELNTDAVLKTHVVIPNQVMDSSSQGQCSCIVPLDSTFSIVPMGSGFTTPPEYRNDDASSDKLAIPFTFSFYGQSFDSLYINNNGNISFSGQFSSFTSTGFPVGGNDMIAPFWADVDTRQDSSGLVYYKMTAHALIVKWDNVGYYNTHADKKNTFQLIITDGTDAILPPGTNVGFCYGDMQWTTGDASSGINGFGGVPTTVGVNKGDNLNFGQITRNDSTGYTYDGPNGLSDGVDWLDYKSFYFNIGDTLGSDPLAYDTLCSVVNPIYDSLGSPYRLFINSMDVNDQVNYTIVKQPAGSTITPVSLGNSILLSMTYAPVQLGMDSLIIQYYDMKGSGNVQTFLRVFDVKASVVGLSDHLNTGKLSVFPNPASSGVRFKLEGTHQIKSVKLTNVIGVTAMETSELNKDGELNIEQLSKGIYVVEVKEETGKVHTSKLIIQ